ncbi:MAG: hypothetical protein WBP18_05865 [Paracoccaceae bacterium]
MNKLRIVVITLAVLGLGVMAAFALFYFSLIRPLEQALAPATAENAAVEVLAGDPDAVILMPFVTGDVPRLVTGPQLEALRPQLWYDDTETVGTLFGGLVVATMGVPPITDIATAFKDGVPIKAHVCITISCNLGANDLAATWGVAGLKGLGDALGPEVRQDHLSFGDHAAYLAAHAVVLADPLQWFAQPGAEVALPGDDGLRLVVISLPTEVLAHAPVFGANDEDPAREAELTALAEGLVEGTGGTVEAVLGTAPMPIWVISEGMPLFDAGGALRALPDLTFRNPVLRLSVPEAGVAVVQERLDALAFPGPDGAALAGAVRAAFAGWGLDPDCLPGCGGVDTDLRDRVALDAGPAPFWVLDVWHVPKGG